jgi:prephenate dehydrogenase
MSDPDFARQSAAGARLSRPLSELHVAIVGLGLMGGSLAGALRGRCRQVTGVARRPESVEFACAHGFADRGTTDLKEGLRGADAVVLATPVRVILRLLGEIGPFLDDGCLLIDLGSTKTQILDRMAALPDHVQPLGAHPMCGKEVAGIEAAEADLYHGQTFVLAPLARTSRAALSLGRRLVEAVGARPVVLEPRRHDRLVATISHLPYLLACGLVGLAEERAAQDPAVWQVAASGFRDTSRLAASDVTMMLDILMTNQEAVLDALEGYQHQLHRLADLIAAGDEVTLRTALQARQARRAGM